MSIPLAIGNCFDAIHNASGIHHVIQGRGKSLKHGVTFLDRLDRLLAGGTDCVAGKGHTSEVLFNAIRRLEIDRTESQLSSILFVSGLIVLKTKGAQEDNLRMCGEERIALLKPWCDDVI